MSYMFQVASDIIRDGLGLELVHPKFGVIGELFRCDANRTLTVTLYQQDIPFVEVEKLIGLARGELQCFEDGTPLPMG